jgi:hypothetical protein
MTETEMDHGTVFNKLTWLIAREDFINRWRYFIILFLLSFCKYSDIAKFALFLPAYYYCITQNSRDIPPKCMKMFLNLLLNLLRQTLMPDFTQLFCTHTKISLNLISWNRSQYVKATPSLYSAKFTNA